MAEKKRAYCKNTVQGRQRGRKYPPKFRAEVVMAMLTTNSMHDHWHCRRGHCHCLWRLGHRAGSACDLYGH